MPVEAREKKMRQSVKAVEAAEDKAAEEKAETHLAKEKVPDAIVHLCLKIIHDHP